jgi:hypothetical protein
LSQGTSTQCRKCSYQKRKTYESAAKQLISHSKWRAHKKTLPFEISYEYAMQKFKDQKGLCAVSGIPIEFALGRVAHKHGETTASLDRIDSSKGYTKGNIQWVHKRVNSIKSDMTMPELISFCSAILEYNKNGS